MQVPPVQVPQQQRQWRRRRWLVAAKVGVAAAPVAAAQQQQQLHRQVLVLPAAVVVKWRHLSQLQRRLVGWAVDGVLGTSQAKPKVQPLPPPKPRCCLGRPASVPLLPLL